MTTTQKLIEGQDGAIRNILIDLTDVTGFDHADASLDAFGKAKFSLNKLFKQSLANILEAEIEWCRLYLSKVNALYHGHSKEMSDKKQATIGTMQDTITHLQSLLELLK